MGYLDALAKLITDVGPALIAFAVPFVVALAKRVFLQLPTWLVPILAMVIPMIGDALYVYVSGIGSSSPVGMAALGLAAIGIREIFDQLRKALGF